MRELLKKFSQKEQDEILSFPQFFQLNSNEFLKELVEERHKNLYEIITNEENKEIELKNFKIKQREELNSYKNNYNKTHRNRNRTILLKKKEESEEVSSSNNLNLNLNKINKKPKIGKISQLKRNKNQLSKVILKGKLFSLINKSNIMTEDQFNDIKIRLSLAQLEKYRITKKNIKKQFYYAQQNPNNYIL